METVGGLFGVEECENWGSALNLCDVKRLTLVAGLQGSRPLAFCRAVIRMTSAHTDL